MMEVLNVDGFTVSMFGDCFETLLWLTGRGPELARRLETLVDANAVLIHEADGAQMVEVKAGEFVSDQILAQLNGEFQIQMVRRLLPVLPVVSRRDTQVPFTTCADMLRHDAGPTRRFGSWRWNMKWPAAT